uniref:PDZ and LIM domain protein Zasp n=1 Tax=Strongyloides stercoralis TaxID=6248 RepID=A0A0K0EH47_STRER
MINKEMITVRMNRADVNTPWGFQVKPPGIIFKIEGGSLADRAGIQHGDEISKIQNENVNDFNRLQNIIIQPIHEIELILNRNMSSTRIWKPIISETSEPDHFQKSTTNLQSNVKVNLEHKSLNCDPLVNGFNTSPRPFAPTLQNTHDTVGNQKNFESTASHSIKAEQYLKEKGGLFGTDPNAQNAFNQKQNQPSYLNSETLKLIQEDDKREKRDKTPVINNNNLYKQESYVPKEIMTSNNINHNLPVCFICGRNILGLVCRAFDVNVHADCFSCSTCGSNLKNQGHHFVNSKFYCDVHGRQIKSLSQQRYSPNTLKIPYQHENKAVNIHSSENNIYQHDLSKASFQTDIMARQPILSEKQNEEIIKNYSSSNCITMTNKLMKTSTPFYGSSHDYDTLNVNVDKLLISPEPRNLKKSPLPKEIRDVTVKYLKKSDNLPIWPPTESSATSPQKYWSINLAPYTRKENKSLLDLVVEEDLKTNINNNNYFDIHSPTLSSIYNKSQDSSLLDNYEYKEPITIPTTNIERLTPPRISPRRCKKKDLQKKEINKNYDFIPIVLEKDDKYSNQLMKLPEIVTTPLINDTKDDTLKIEKQIRWVENPEIIEETDILTEESFSDYRLNENKNSYEDIEADESDCIDEQEQWIKEELEEYRREEELEKLKAQKNNLNLSFKNDDNLKNEKDNNKNNNFTSTLLNNSYDVFEENKLTELIKSTQKLLEHVEEKHGIMRDEKISDKLIFENEEDSLVEKYKGNSTQQLIEETRQEVEKMKAELRDKSIVITDREYKPITFNNPINYEMINHQRENSSFSQYESTKFITPANYICNNIKKFYTENDLLCKNMSSSNKCLDYHQQQPNYKGKNYSEIDDNNKSSYTTQKNITFNSNTTRNSQQPYENRIPICNQCRTEIHGAFVMTGGNTYCPEHFVCANTSCSRKLVDIGFVEERGQRFCEVCFEKLIAPVCGKCNKPITGDCLNALQKQFHPQCFTCAHCMKVFGNAAFYLENGKPYCERDWNNLFTTKCVSCKFPIEAGDRWVEALGASFHSNCFSCVVCHVNLEGQSFYAKNNQPYCRMHA